ncbi:MAG: hypothetical protein HS102_14450 [Planctomycetia bacterium]|nr:hypothetical protein [Planctomycetia bacterium]
MVPLMCSHPYIISLLLLPCQESSAVMPPELQSIAWYAENLCTTARIEWVTRVAGEERRLTSVYTADEALLIDDGVNHAVSDAHVRAKDFAYSRRSKLLRRGESQWVYNALSPIAHVHGADSHEFSSQMDLRAALVAPSRPEWANAQDSSPMLHLQKHLSDVDHYETSVDSSSRPVVRAVWPTGRTMTWTLDPGFDGLPTHVQTMAPRFDGGLQVRDCEIEYLESDGRWFPKSFRYYMNGKQESVIEVRHAEFDRPYHPEKLSIGEAFQMPAGVNVYQAGKHGWDSTTYAFDGVDGLVYGDDFVEAVNSGSLKLAAFRRMRELPEDVRLGRVPQLSYLEPVPVYLAEPGSISRRPDAWERYTREFIRKHRLRPRQEEAAWKLLAQCRVKAFDYLRSNSHHISEAARVKDATRNSSVGGDREAVADDHENQKIKERLDKLYAPVDKIFTDMLQPGLQNLLTPEQRSQPE